MEEELKALEEIKAKIPEKILRKSLAKLPELSEVEVVRHFTRLSQQNYGVDLGIYPLGSCTMKYNPKISEEIVRSPKLTQMHPYQDMSLAQGILRIMYELQIYLSKITGMDKFSLQPAAGAQGEFVGALIMRAYHRDRDKRRNEIIVPDSSHGTNPASASMAGFKVIVIPSNDEGLVDLEALKASLSDRTAGMMITNPNTLGLFEVQIAEIARMVHEAGGLMYYDGANLNAILGKVRPGDMGFDIVHVNLHKTFAVPHGGGGPGAGPVGVKDYLKDYLPIPTVEFNGKEYYLDYNKEKSIGRVRSFYGNVAHLVRAYIYLLALGPDGLERVSEISVLNANYIMMKLSKYYDLPKAKGKFRMHEVVLSSSKIKRDTGVRTMDISKALLDKGIHPPTIYFPLIVEEALMIEPTETESKEELDRLIQAMIDIREQAYKDPESLLNSPQNTTISRVDELKANHPKSLKLTWRYIR